MFNFERNAGNGLRTQAISTAMAGIFSDLLLEATGTYDAIRGGLRGQLRKGVGAHAT